MQKRAQISSETFVYALTVALVGIVISMGYTYINGNKDSLAKVNILQFQNNIISDIESVGNEYGNSKKILYTAQGNLQEVCFVDLSKKDEILSSRLVSFYPFIMDSLKSNSRKNVFFIGSFEKSSLYVDNIKINHFPYMFCYAPDNGKIEINLQGLGGGNTLISEDFTAKSRLNNYGNTVLKSVDRIVSIEVPKGAVSNPPVNEISVEMIKVPVPSALPASDAYALQPYGARFNKPVELKIKYNPSIVGECPILINFYHYNDDGTEKEIVPLKSIDCENKILAFEINSFSYGYAAMPNSRVSDLKELNADVFSLNNEYKKADEPRKKQIGAELKQFSAQRKLRMLELAENNPQEFLNNALSSDKMNEFPLEVQEEFEKESALFTYIDVLHMDNLESRYFIKSGKEKLELHLAGSPPLLMSGTKVKVKGYRLGNNMVAAASPNSFEVLEEAPEQDTVGEQKVAVFLVDFLDSGARTITKESAAKLFFDGNINNFFKEASYGKLHLSGDVFDWYKLPRNGITYSNGVIDGQCAYPGSNDKELEEIINRNKADMSKYSAIMLLGNHNCMNNGGAFIGKVKRFVNNKEYSVYLGWSGGLSNFRESAVKPNELSTHFEYVISHEFGHNLGALHANSWNCGENIFYGLCNEIEYGNHFDVMGEVYNSAHFNAYYKNLFSWLDGKTTIDIVKSGTYALKPLESESGLRAAKIIIPGFENAVFYLEYRRGIGFDSKLNEPSLISNQNGLFINQVLKDGSTGYKLTRLLDMTPGIFSLNGVTLNQGQSYKDEKHGFTIGPIISADENGITFDVKIGDAQKNPIIRIEPISFDVQLNQGEKKYLSFKIHNEGNVNLIWSASSDSNWLILDERQTNLATEPEKSTDLNARIDTAMIQVGDSINSKGEYTANININSNDENIKIPVSIKVIGAAKVSVQPQQFFFSAAFGEHDVPAQEFKIINSWQEDIKWGVITGNPFDSPVLNKWLDVRAESDGVQSGNINAGSTEKLLVQVKTDGLPAGEYIGYFYIIIRDSSFKIPVRLSISETIDLCQSQLEEKEKCSGKTSNCVQTCNNKDYYCLSLNGIWAWRTSKKITDKCTKESGPCAKFEWPKECEKILGENSKGNAGSCYALDNKFHFDFEEVCSDGTIYQEIGKCAKENKIKANCNDMSLK